jgi:hypothetical protein
MRRQDVWMDIWSNNMKRAISLAQINHSWNRYNRQMLRSWPIKIPNMNKMWQRQMTSCVHKMCRRTYGQTTWKGLYLSLKSTTREISIICVCSDHGQPSCQIWIKCDKRQMTSCVHKMCGQTYFQTNMKRAITLGKINHPYLSLSHFIHIWYLDWPWSEHLPIIPISWMVDFCKRLRSRRFRILARKIEFGVFGLFPNEKKNIFVKKQRILMNFHIISAYNSEISSELSEYSEWPRKKIRNCPNTPNDLEKKFGIVRILRIDLGKKFGIVRILRMTWKKNSEFRIKDGNYNIRKFIQNFCPNVVWGFFPDIVRKFFPNEVRNCFPNEVQKLHQKWQSGKNFRTISGKNPQTTFGQKFCINFLMHKFP